MLQSIRINTYQISNAMLDFHLNATNIFKECQQILIRFLIEISRAEFDAGTPLLHR